VCVCVCVCPKGVCKKTQGRLTLVISFSLCEMTSTAEDGTDEFFEGLSFRRMTHHTIRKTFFFQAPTHTHNEQS
jgi:hypothetical protein